MPLQVANQPALLPTGLLSANLNAFVSPVENIVHGYNMAEQTCFHKTTVSNVIPGFSRISAFVRAIGALLQPVTTLISAATTLIADVTSAVGLTRAMLTAATAVIGAVTTVVGTVTTLVGTTIGLVTTIITTLGGIATACLVAGIATIVAGVLFGFGFVGAGGIALTVLLAIFFFVVRGAVVTIATALAGVTGALGTLTAPLGTLTGALGPLNTAIGAVNGILANPALPSDVTRSLAEVSTALTNLQNDLATGGQLTNTLASTTTTLDDRVAALRTFLAATPAGQAKVPRAHLEDTYRDAVAIYNAGVTATQAMSPQVWNAMLAPPPITNNAPQIEPGGIVDTTLRCPVEFREG